MATSPPSIERGVVDRFLGLFSDVRSGEGARALLMLSNIFLILVSYYIIKTVREPLILNTEVPRLLRDLGIRGPAEIKTYASAGQALVLMGFIPAYSWFASRVDRMKLVFGITGFFVINILLFAAAVSAGLDFVGIAFYIWVGFFSLSIIAQFWSYANDLYTKDAGDRIFPIVGIGMTAGSPVGAWIAARMFGAHLPPHMMLSVAAGLLLASGVLYFLVNRRDVRQDQAGGTRAAASQKIGGKGGFTLVFASRYITLIAVLLILLNVVNTVGEYILSHLVVARAAQAALVNPTFDRTAFVGAFYGNYFFWVNVVAVALQAFVASRLVKWFGLAGVLLVLPFIALGAYGIVACGATLVAVRWVKTAENSTDYSIMNTARQLLWLPTSREEKYKAKQAVDSFFVRCGDVLAALVVFAGTGWLTFGARGFALLNIGFIAIWLVIAVVLLREHRRLRETVEATPHTA